MGSTENIIGLLILAIFTYNARALRLCDVKVNVTYDTIAAQGEPFNITLTFTNVTEEKVFSLTPEWDKLIINQSEIQLDKDSSIDVEMISNQFYLYNVILSCKTNESHVESDVFEVPVSRTVTSNTIALVFQRIMTVSLAFAMLLMGCELKFEIVKSYLMRPLAPLAGMVCQYICMPVMAYLIGYIFLSDNIYARYGLILVGCSPGGSFSNFWAGK